jgi:CO/xanthine dehydrogenase Mo-binding subunit
VEVLAGATELGQGAHRVLGDLAADALGIPPEHVDVRLGDTDSSPFDRGTNASRTTVGLGLAIEDAGHRIQEILTDAWARSGRDGIPHLDGGDLVNESARAAIPQVFSEALGLPAREFPGVTVTGSHVAVPAAGSTEFETMFFEVGTAGAEVRVDTDTGQIEISRMVSVIEAGKALSLRGSHGQNVGAAMMGIGTTLSEQLLYVAGELQNANMIEYRVPTMGSLPSQGIESLLIENGDGPGPQGAKGLGEAGIIAVAPAIANALQAAVGVRIRDLPLTPESVWRAMSNRVDPELLSALPREAEV